MKRLLELQTKNIGETGCLKLAAGQMMMRLSSLTFLNSLIKYSQKDFRRILIDPGEIDYRERSKIMVPRYYDLLFENS